MLLALLSGLIIVLGGALGGKTGIVIAFGLALIMNVGSYWYSDKIVLRMYQARELSESEAPMIYSMVRELAANAQIPMPRIAVVPEEAPNAFATGRNPENSVVAVTEGILRLLSPEELKGVLAHEIAHIANRDILIQTVAGVRLTIVSNGAEKRVRPFAQKLGLAYLYRSAKPLPFALMAWFLFSYPGKSAKNNDGKIFFHIRSPLCQDHLRPLKSRCRKIRKNNCQKHQTVSKKRIFFHKNTINGLFPNICSFAKIIICCIL